MKLCLTGLPQSGKSTIFSALTQTEPETGFSGGKQEPKLAVVEVLDERITKLSQMYDPKKTIYAKIELADFPAPADRSENSNAFPTELLQELKIMDALGVVIRNFDDTFLGSPKPIEDLDTFSGEMIVADLIVTENRLEKIAHSFARGQKTPELQREHNLLQKIKVQLESDRKVDALDLTAEERKQLRGFQFLTNKPWLIILNSGEEQFHKNDELLEKIREYYPAIEFAGKFEMELSQMEADDAKLFMDDLGITESAAVRLTDSAYKILGYISFFTVGPDEVRAWTIRKGTKAVGAAAAIHNDLARGFIRAECFHYDDLLECGSEKGLRQKGKFRLEGKEYVVRDGDILNIRFNV
ncbi:MAG: redox-regulated ATPase YchF [FCB group bacterium]|nr:redox-regulated ATPase YchF [FCB group bacterium]